jgi:hypothetical protein
MILLKPFSAARNELATQRLTILPSCQFVTLLVLVLTPEFGLSMMFVDTRHFLRLAGSESRFTVNISWQPYRMLADAEG